MNRAKRIFLESIKPGLPSLVANAYAEAFLAGESMVAFAVPGFGKECVMLRFD